MPRVKRAIHAQKKRRAILEQAKGYWGWKHSHYRYAKEQVDRLDPGGRFDEVLTLRDEQLELVAPAPVVELADELEPLVVAGGDQRVLIRRS